MSRQIPWTDREIEILKSMLRDGHSNLEIATRLGRSRSSVVSRISAIGKKSNKQVLGRKTLKKVRKNFKSEYKFNQGPNL